MLRHSEEGLDPQAPAPAAGCPCALRGPQLERAGSGREDARMRTGRSKLKAMCCPNWSAQEGPNLKPCSASNWSTMKEYSTLPGAKFIYVQSITRTISTVSAY
jgi:hypothetical protein